MIWFPFNWPEYIRIYKHAMRSHLAHSACVSLKDCLLVLDYCCGSDTATIAALAAIASVYYLHVHKNSHSEDADCRYLSSIFRAWISKYHRASEWWVITASNWCLVKLDMWYWSPSVDCCVTGSKPRVKSSCEQRQIWSNWMNVCSYLGQYAGLIKCSLIFKVWTLNLQ